MHFAGCFPSLGVGRPMANLSEEPWETRGRESIVCNRQAGRCGCRNGLEESYHKSSLSEERAKEYQPLLESDVSCVYPHIAPIKSSSFASLFCIIALLGCSLCSAESCNYVIEPNLPDF